MSHRYRSRLTVHVRDYEFNDAGYVRSDTWSMVYKAIRQPCDPIALTLVKGRFEPEPEQAILR
jgi:hypothetical protein